MPVTSTRFRTLPVWLIALAVLVADAGQSHAQFGKRLFRKSGSSSSPPTSSSRSQPTSGRNSNGSQYDNEFDDDVPEAPELDRGDDPEDSASEEKPSFLRRMFRREKKSGNTDSGSASSSKKSSTKKKDSELINPKDLTPIKQKPVEPYGGKRQTNSLAAPKSTREGTPRKEPISLSPADSTPGRSRIPPAKPGIVPPAPEDSDGFFVGGETDEVAYAPIRRQPVQRTLPAQSPQRTQQQPPARLGGTQTPSKQTVRRPVVDEFGLEESPSDAADSELFESDEAGDVVAMRDTPVSAPPDDDETTSDSDSSSDDVGVGELESTFDSPYTGATISPRETESKRVEIPRIPIGRGTVSTQRESESAAAPTILKAPPVDDLNVGPSSLPEPAVAGATRVPIIRKNSPQVAGKNGLQGYCPVALKDARELVRAQPEFRVQFGGRTYELSSPEAKKQFESNPRRYIPALNGQDVVRLGQGERGVEGTLEHAAWFRGRLYLFASEETLALFVKSPADFVSFP